MMKWHRSERKRVARALCAGVTVMALAGAGGSATRIDTDGDGRYSLAELRVFYPKLTAQDFSRIDTDGDGHISPGEFRAAQDDGLLIVARSE